jgi:hypothetical protein
VGQVSLAVDKEASPPYIVGVSVAEFMYPIRLTGVTERARRAVGQWPSAESMVDRMLTILNERAEDAPPDERPRWRRLRDGFAGAGRDVAVEFAAALLARGAGA